MFTKADYNGQIVCGKEWGEAREFEISTVQAFFCVRAPWFCIRSKNPLVVGVRVQGLEDAAQLKINVDEGKANALGVALGDINNTLQTCFGSAYVNNFINGNRVQRVIVQLDAPFRMSPDDVKNLYVRNRTGTMVPLSTFTTMKWIYGSPQLQN